MSEEMTEFLKDVARVLPNTPLAERAIALKTKLTTTPEPAGETVRVRAGVYRVRQERVYRFKRGELVVFGRLNRLGEWVTHHCHENEPTAIIEADIPLPRIPTVAARVVEDQP
jgi:hypothetical protein